jgi:tryptophan-rich sensory protein
MPAADAYVTADVLCCGAEDKRAVPLTLYSAQLALNLAWTPLFFKQHALDVALVDSVGEWLQQQQQC